MLKLTSHKLERSRKGFLQVLTLRSAGKCPLKPSRLGKAYFRNRAPQLDPTKKWQCTAAPSPGSCVHADTARNLPCGRCKNTHPAARLSSSSNNSNRTTHHVPKNRPPAMLKLIGALTALTSMSIPLVSMTKKPRDTGNNQHLPTDGRNIPSTPKFQNTLNIPRPKPKYSTP